jgi:hypothetical protein
MALIIIGWITVVLATATFIGLGIALRKDTAKPHSPRPADENVIEVHPYDIEIITRK